MVKNLKLKDPDLRLNRIKNYTKNLINLFNKNYKIDYKSERQKLHFETMPIGLETYINKANEIDKSKKQGISIINGIIISGNPGTGKTRLLNEISNRMLIEGRYICNVEIDTDDIIKEEVQMSFIIQLMECQELNYKLLLGTFAVHHNHLAEMLFFGSKIMWFVNKI